MGAEKNLALTNFLMSLCTCGTVQDSGSWDPEALDKVGTDLYFIWVLIHCYTRYYTRKIFISENSQKAFLLSGLIAIYLYAKKIFQ